MESNQRYIGNTMPLLVAEKTARAVSANVENLTFTPNRNVIRSADFHNASVSTFSTVRSHNFVRHRSHDTGWRGWDASRGVTSCRSMYRGNCHAVIYSPWRKFPQRNQRRNSDRPHCRLRSVSDGNSWSRNETLDHHLLTRVPNRHSTQSTATGTQTSSMIPKDTSRLTRHGDRVTAVRPSLNRSLRTKLPHFLSRSDWLTG